MDGQSPIDEFLDELTELHRAKIMKWLKYLENEGPNLPRPYADTVEGKIRELRISIAHHQYRLLYFFSGKTIVIIHAFLKKTSEVPKREIERARRCMENWLGRFEPKGGS